MSLSNKKQQTQSVKTLLNIQEDEENYYLGVWKSAIKDIQTNPLIRLYNWIFSNEIIFILMISVF